MTHTSIFSFFSFQIMSENNDESGAAACVFFKAPIRRGNAQASAKRRQRSSSKSSASSSSSSGDESQPSAAALRTSKQVRQGLVSTSSSNASSKRRQQAANSDDDDAGEHREHTNKDKMFEVKFKSDRQAQPQGPRDMGATATVEIDTDTKNDQQTIFERAKKINEELKGKADDKIYRGMNNYQQFYEKRDTVHGNASSGLVRNKGLLIIHSTQCDFRVKFRSNSCTSSSSCVSSMGLSARYLQRL